MGARRTPTSGKLLLAAVALCGVVAVHRGGRMLAARAAQEAELGATLEALELARQRVQAHWDSVGTPPVSLDQLGMGPLPFAYVASGTAFRLSAPSPFGGSVGYQSPTRRDVRIAEVP